MIDEIAKRELQLFIDNNYELYRSQVIPMIANVKNKIKRGTYSPERAPLLWRYLIDEGAKKYCKEFGGTAKRVFPATLRRVLAEEYAIFYKQGIDLGNYDEREAN